MRQETWFRGPLLSVLFFSLLWGGGVPAVSADLLAVSASSGSTDYEDAMRAECEAGGGEWVGSGVGAKCDYAKLAEECERMRRERTDAGVLAVAGGVIAAIPGGQAIGLIVGIIGGWGTVVTHVNIVDQCRMAGF